MLYQGVGNTLQIILTCLQYNDYVITNLVPPPLG